jgi:hypothetical protein
MTSPSARGAGSLRRVEAIFRNPALYALSEAIPRPDRTAGGRPGTYPPYMLLAFEAMISVYRSARGVETELADPLVWGFIRSTVTSVFPGDPSKHLPAEPMRRHHYLYGRERYLTDPAILAEIRRLYRVFAAEQARELGLLDPEGPGSWTHPDLSRMLHADGKVITPLYLAKPGDTRVDLDTGEVFPRRADPDGRLHFEGDGQAAWGTKFVLVAARSQDERGRVILDLEWVPRGDEAGAALDCFRRLAPLVPGAHGVVYDTALRGKHHQVLLRELGLMPVNRVAAAAGKRRAPRGIRRPRAAKSAHVEDKVLRRPDGSSVRVSIYAMDGAVGIGELTVDGEMRFTPFRRVRTHRICDGTGLFRWYNDYRLPTSLGGGVLTVRLHGNDEDEARGFNRTENVRAIPPSDPDFRQLYGRRNDAESINRHLVDTMWLGRAHSVGHVRQHVNLLGFALMVNGLALLEHRHRQLELPRAA